VDNMQPERCVDEISSTGGIIPAIAWKRNPILQRVGAQRQDWQGV
jgi:hypothetical protein